MAIRNVREHLSEHHKQSAGFDLSVAGELERVRKSFEALEAQADGDAKESFAACKVAFDKLGAAFNQHAVYHEKMKQACEKSDGSDDLEKLAPSGISAVYDPAKGPRAVIRPGQREIPGAGEMPVPLEFQHLVKATDDRE
jgi:hypothetical protein